MTAIRYTLSMPRPHSHLFHVRIDVRGAPGEATDFVLPVWTPGSYKVRDYARNLQDFSAGPHEWRKVDKSRWRVLAGGDLRVEYDVFAFELTVQSSHLDAEHGYVNGAGVFCYVDGRKDASVELEIRAPRGWRIATGLERKGRIFTAPNYDILVDCPIEIGTFQERTFRVKGVPHRLVIHGPGNYDLEGLLRDVRKIVETEVSIFRHIPYRDYTFILHHTTERGGGLEHLNSTSLQVGPHAYRPREKYENVLELVAHEFFHLWNVKRIRPEMLGPFDYEKEVYTTLLWVMEGITSYYDTLVPCRAKLFTPEKYFKKMADRIQKYGEKPGRKRQSLSQSSFDTWIKLYQPNENATNSQMSYYEKGELVGMCLDLEIRHRTGNRKSLDDVLRLVYQEYGRAGRGFPEGEFKRACERVAGKLDRFFADAVEGVTDLPFGRYLAHAGCELHLEPRKAEEGELRRPHRPWIGLTTQKAGPVLSVAGVIEGSPADRAGLSAKDELVAMDGMKINPDEWEKRIDERDPGDRLRLTVFRSGFLREMTVALGRQENVTWTIRKQKSATAAQKKVYEGWLGSRWDAPKKKK
jgi:predicted metalloprotease with PDZ domain